MPSEAPMPTPDPVDNMDNAGTEATQKPANDDWRSALSDDIKGNPTLEKIKSVNALASSYINLQSHLGRDKITKPITEDDWQDVYNFLGRPQGPDGYDLSLPDELPEPVKGQFNDEGLGAFKKAAHSFGLSANQAQDLLGWYADLRAQQHAAMQENSSQSLENAERELHQKWGRAYEQNVGYARKAFEEYGGDDLARIMDGSGLGNHPAVLEAFANIAKSTMADKDLAGPTNQGKQVLTPEEAKAEAATVMAHPAYLDKNHPEHTSVVRKVQSLFERAYGDA